MTNAGEDAGDWLKAARSDAGYATAAEFARAIGVERYMLSTYETGKSRPSDETAQKIADVLDIDIITVRRNLGLWIPPEADEQERLAALSRDELINEAKRAQKMLDKLVKDLQRRSA